MPLPSSYSCFDHRKRWNEISHGDNFEMNASCRGVARISWVRISVKMNSSHPHHKSLFIRTVMNLNLVYYFVFGLMIICFSVKPLPALQCGMCIKDCIQVLLRTSPDSICQIWFQWNHSMNRTFRYSPVLSAIKLIEREILLIISRIVGKQVTWSN